MKVAMTGEKASGWRKKKMDPRSLHQSSLETDVVKKRCGQDEEMRRVIGEIVRAECQRTIDPLCDDEPYTSGSAMFRKAAISPPVSAPGTDEAGRMLRRMTNHCLQPYEYGGYSGVSFIENWTQNKQSKGSEA